MDKKQVIKEYKKVLNQLNLFCNELVLGAGAALIMHGLRERTHDLDLDIPSHLFYVLSADHEAVYKEGKLLLLKYDKFNDLHIYNPLIKTQIIEGVCVYTLEELLKQKLELNRPKDQDDIVNIRKYLDARNSYV